MFFFPGTNSVALFILSLRVKIPILWLDLYFQKSGEILSKWCVEELFIDICYLWTCNDFIMLHLLSLEKKQ